jgi:hypothetical protein
MTTNTGGSVHLVIPDTQVKADVDLSHLPLIGKYALEKRPDVIVMIGDFADMPSLSSYDKGKKSFEGRRYKKDVEAAKYAMSLLMKPIKEYNDHAAANHRARYKPRLILTLGNHEDRITRAIESDPMLDGTISIDDLEYEKFGWEVYPYLEVVNVDGIAYSHFFTSGTMGRPVSSARALVAKKHMSCTMGHVQDTDIAMAKTGDGKEIIGLFSGTCYLHDENYLGAQGNGQRRHIVMKYRVKDGSYDPHFVSLDYLFEHYDAKRNEYVFINK